MNLKISGQSSKSNYKNNGSSASAVFYNEHDLREYLDEALELGAQDKQMQFFDMKGHVVTAAEVLDKVDRHHSGLHKDDAKFYCIMLNPSDPEIATMGENLTERLANGKKYLFDVMDAYARNFHREGIEDRHNLTAYAIPHLYKGEEKKEQLHWHIIVARKDASNKYKLSPLTNHRSTTKGAVKGGFDRVAFDKECEQLFDKRFGYERNVEESFDYCLAQKKGTPEQKAEQTRRLTEQIKPELEASIRRFVAERKKNKFDFVEAAKAMNQTSYEHKSEPPKINFCELMMLVDTRTEFEKNLFIKHKAVIAPINDVNGHCADFELTLAGEGRKVKASEILDSESELRVMIKRWTTLGQQEQGNQQQKVTTAPQYIEQERFNVYDKDYAAQFKKHFEEALEYNFTSPYQFAAIMNLRGIQVTAIGKDDTDVEMCFRGHIRGEEVTYWYGQEEVGIDAMNRLQAKLDQNKEEHKAQYREQARVATIAKKLFEWSTSQQHFEKMLKKKGIDVVFYRAEDNPEHIAGVTFIDHTVKTAFKASELDKSIAASVFDKAVESGHWKAEDTTKAMDEDNIITEWQEDELAKDIKTALNLLGKGGGPLFQNTRGNHAGKTKNQIAWEKQQAEEEQQAHIYRHRR